MSAQQQRIGQYRIIRKIGAGGMGLVFAAEHVLLGRRAAIKTLLPSLSSQPHVVERFFKEARATSVIADPGIVQVFDFGYHVDGTAYIVMELLEGESLISRIERLGSLPLRSALRVARQVASSLAAAHARDIVHRDLKPENIFLIRDREALGGERTKVLDFGICKFGDGDEVEHSVFGTPVYMAPEQCRGAEYVDHRTDIYALGCVLFEMLTGRVPYERDTAEELVHAHLYEAPPIASAMAGGIPPLVDELLACCLAKAPEERFPTMNAVGAAIEQVIAQLDAQAGVTVGWGKETTAIHMAALGPLGDGFCSVSDANARAVKAALEDATWGTPAAAAAAAAGASAAAATPSSLGGAGGTRVATPAESGPVGSPSASASMRASRASRASRSVPPAAVERLSRPALRRAGFGVALLAAAAAASFVTRSSGGDATLSVSTPAAIAAPLPDRAAVAPPPPPAAAPPRAAAAEYPVVSPPPEPPPATQAAPVPGTAPRPPRPPIVSARASSEDLYDMR